MQPCSYYASIASGVIPVFKSNAQLIWHLLTSHVHIKKKLIPFKGSATFIWENSSWQPYDEFGYLVF